MKKLGFIGCGKIGRALMQEVVDKNLAEIVFIQDKADITDGPGGIPIIQSGEEALYEKADLIVECAVAEVLYENVEMILKHCDLMMFSIAAFADGEFEQKVRTLAAEYSRKVYLPHGAILGLDGIFDGKRLWEEVSVETVKNPKSLGRTDTVRTVIYEGNAQGACRAYPRNVNVHAAVAMAGIGFQRTESRIISDPEVQSNSHVISVKGNGTEMEIRVSSQAGSGVTGAYTPFSAIGSLYRALGCENEISVI